ncbi:hypothetical protein QKW60_02850 [Defluviimonas aestuarii]|uniref:2-keto-4-pentenoate hydratase n=1 Tax=Albidovulum aestuarii TaxID=1130726 RepID=UPI00249BDEC7|nr:fumarylacetoacetate hydrolase family protein [Defluviimonas aestuarii]MDI3335334.1 hypothetical protein [Defluviimonas aestuarii]
MATEEAEKRTARTLLDLLGSGRQSQDIEVPDMTAANRICAHVRTLREARGERVIGRKIGFSNRTIWPIYGVDRPMWNYVWHTTLIATADGEAVVDLQGVPEPRIEPEIVLHLASAPEPGMSEDELLGCIYRVAHGFEIVQSVYPGWKFSAPQSAAAFGLHGALAIGWWQDISSDRMAWGKQLGDFTVTLNRNGSRVETGHATNVLGGPVSALRFLVETIADEPHPAPLQAGEIVSTGTLTDAQPVAPGTEWTAEFTGIDLAPLRVICR